jgi:hypothetical protein
MHIKPPSTAPYSIRQLRIDNPGTSFPANPSDELLAEWGVFPVITSTAPEYDAALQYFVAADPVFIGEQWVQQWEVVGYSDDIVADNKIRALAEIINLNNAAYEAAIAALTRAYPPSEIATWERQRAESLAWSINADAPTPWIDIASTARGIPRDEYLARTLSKATQFAQASAYLTGLRQRYEHDIKAATNGGELAAITFGYTLPGAV